MAVERLYIEGTYIPMTSGLNPSITKNIADISEPDKRKANYTKTVTLPRSKEVDNVFSQIFEVNLVDGSFNPNVKADVVYTCDDESILEGYLRLSSINVTDRDNIFYEVVLFSGNADFFVEIKNNFLSDLYESTADFEGLDIYNHVLTRELQQLSWDTEIIINGSLEPFEYGTGYVYPLIDYGFSLDATKFFLTDMSCAIYEREYMRRIINYAGFTYTSAFLDSAYFKRFIIPSSPECYQLDSDEIADREFSANTPELTSTGTTTSNDIPVGVYSAHDGIIFTNELSDPGLNYDPLTGIYTAVTFGTYNFMSLVHVNATFTPATGVAVKTSCEVDGYFTLRHTPVSTGVEVQVQAKAFFITSKDAAFTVGARSTSSTPTYPDEDYMDFISGDPREWNPPDEYYLEHNNIVLAAGDEVRLTWIAKIVSYTGVSTELFIDSGGTYYDGDATVDMPVGAFYNKVTNTKMVQGNPLLMSKVIPDNIRMIDYFMSNVKRFNLFVEVDPANPKNLLIEPRDDYYSSSVLNIHALIYRSKPITYLPMGDLDAKEYRFGFKPDGDYWNKHYENKYQMVYGDRWALVESEFASEIKKTEVIFSPTPMVGIPGNDRVLPTIYSIDEHGQPVSTKHNIRSLYYGGLKPCKKAWIHVEFAWTSAFDIENPDVLFNYPYAGHWDDPYNPTEDINFGLVKEVFYDDDLTAIVATNNNLVNKYWGKYLREITDKNSKVVKAWVHINPGTFTDFSFEKLYFFDYAYHRLHKIDGYNPTKENTTLCEFLYLTDASDFVPHTQTLDGNPDKPFIPDQTGGAVKLDETSSLKSVFSSDQPNGNTFQNKNAKVSGEHNYVSNDAMYVDVQGKYNRIFQDAENIKIQGDNNYIGASAKNVTLINTTGVTVLDSDVTYIDGKRQGYFLLKTSDFTADDEVQGYYIDATAGDVTVTLQSREKISDWVFKRMDNSAFNVTIDPTATGTIDGDLTQVLLQYESIRVRWNDDEGEYSIIN